MINTKRIFSITHEQNVDGLFCRAILKNAFSGTLVFLTNYGHKNIESCHRNQFNVSRSSKSGTIIISDLGIDSVEDIKPIKNTAVNARNYGWDFLWLHHHVWSEKIKKSGVFASLILSKNEMYGRISL
jgi:oligoribonuclease NrnB/cAMP/cGMP phosphodiesterase (DHH superfamily)